MPIEPGSLDEHPFVSVVISNLNGAEVLGECLDSLRRLTYPNYEVVVVDAQSDDGSCDLVERSFPWVKLIKARRIGVGEAINIGIRASKGRLIAFDFNNDEVAHPSWLSSLVEVIKESDDIGIVGGTRVFHGSDNRIFEAGMKLDFFFHTHQRHRLKRIDDIPMELVNVDYVAVGLFRRELIDEIGWFDEDYYFYGEDADFCLRTRRRGYRVVNVPWALTSVKGSLTVGEGSPRQIYFSRRAGIRLVLKFKSFSPLLLCVLERLLLLFAEATIDVINCLSGSRTAKPTNAAAAFRAYTWTLRKASLTVRAGTEMKKRS
ncbi:MAG: glycosyltransferase family 2 protein [Candidatus Bathyarchaeota archaeon]|nr:glycosyltransferase family 2 protein [Candidatus Bathyarchaeota archaeon]